VLANSARAVAFPLLDTLRTAQPEWNDRDIGIYSFARIPEIDCTALIYFAASVFWRAAAHTWRTKRRSVHIDLGPWEVPFRSFLPGQAQFPQTAALALVVLEGGGAYAINPLSPNDDGCHEHQFTIPGMAFTLYVGGRLREELILMNLAPARQRYAFIYPRAEDVQIARLAGIYLQHESDRCANLDERRSRTRPPRSILEWLCLRLPLTSRCRNEEGLERDDHAVPNVFEDAPENGPNRTVAPRTCFADYENLRSG
jgi:hypothetical protein